MLSGHVAVPLSSKPPKHCVDLLSLCHCRVESKRGRIRRVKYWQTALAILAALFASLAFAEDFKTIKGKEYKNVTVSRVEADGILLRGKTGVSKVYFSELPKDVQERFRSKPAQAATAAEQPKPAQIAQSNAETRRADERRRQEEARFARENSNSSIGILFVTILVIAILVTGIIATVAVVNAKKRRQKRALSGTPSVLAAS
jgi:hypothetical protein